MSVRLAFLLIAACASVSCPASGAGSVVMTGTRVIYPAEAREKTLQLFNEDDHPNLVQVWVDRGNVQSNPANADGPFMLMPAIFRMEPHAGQKVRLVFNGEGVPEDRESLFHLSFSQIPAMKREELEANKLVLMFGNRLKLFYRPRGLAGVPADLPGRMRFTLHANGVGRKVMVDNPMAYHAVVRSASLGEGEALCQLAAAALIAPMSQVQWKVPAGCMTGAGATHLKLVLVNDFGADIVSEVPLL